LPQLRLSVKFLEVMSIGAVAVQVGRTQMLKGLAVSVGAVSVDMVLDQRLAQTVTPTRAVAVVDNPKPTRQSLALAVPVS
jgi:hypothetical protein